MLSKEQIISYQENGFVIPEFRLPEEDLLEIEHKHFDIIKKYPEFKNYCPAVLLKDETMCAMPFVIFLFSFFFLLTLVFFFVDSAISYPLGAFFLPAIATALPFLVRALVFVLWPLTGNPFRCLKPL